MMTKIASSNGQKTRELDYEKQVFGYFRGLTGANAVQLGFF